MKLDTTALETEIKRNNKASDVLVVADALMIARAFIESELEERKRSGFKSSHPYIKDARLALRTVEGAMKRASALLARQK